MSTAVKSSVLARAQRGGGNAQGPGPIDRFLDAVWMERGLSPNTLAAYRADLTALERWLDSQIRFDKGWEGKVVQTVLAKLSTLYDRTIESAADLNRYRKELITGLESKPA